MSAAFKEHVCELLAALGPLRIRPMFGGAGVYRDDVMFALLDDDVLYLKTDAQSRPELEAAGSAVFIIEMKGRTEVTSYWRMPAPALDTSDEAVRWARLGIAAAVRAKRPRKVRSAGVELGPGPWNEG